MTVTQSLQMTRKGWARPPRHPLFSVSVSSVAVASARGSDLASLRGLAFSVLTGRHP